MSTEYVEIGDARLWCGDCLEILPELEDVDAVITDIPYGEETHARARTNSGGKIHNQVRFDAVTGEESGHLFQQFVDKSRRWVVSTVEWSHLAEIEIKNPGSFVRAGVWVKPSYTPQFTGDRPAMGWEAIAILHRKGRKQWNGGGKSAVYYDITVNRKVHDTEKPISLYQNFLNDFTLKGETVLDPFMGSGTTGVACAQLGRKFLGIEIERKYFDIACERIERAQAQGKLFEPEPPKAEQERLAL